MLEVKLASEAPYGRRLQPALEDLVIGTVVGVIEIQQLHHHRTGREARPARPIL